jgi:hypothetical protein
MLPERSLKVASGWHRGRSAGALGAFRGARSSLARLHGACWAWPVCPPRSWVVCPAPMVPKRLRRQGIASLRCGYLVVKPAASGPLIEWALADNGLRQLFHQARPVPGGPRLPGIRYKGKSPPRRPGSAKRTPAPASERASADVRKGPCAFIRPGRAIGPVRGGAGRLRWGPSCLWRRGGRGWRRRVPDRRSSRRSRRCPAGRTASVRCRGRRR